jgi:hypothetical protein
MSVWLLVSRLDRRDVGRGGIQLVSDGGGVQVRHAARPAPGPGETQVGRQRQHPRAGSHRGSQGQTHRRLGLRQGQGQYPGDKVKVSIPEQGAIGGAKAKLTGASASDKVKVRMPGIDKLFDFSSRRFSPIDIKYSMFSKIH